MFKCLICSKEFKSSTHLVKHKINAENYYNKYFKKKGDGVCLNCKKTTSFKSMEVGYFKHCSYKCASSSKLAKEKREETCLKKYGVDNPFKDKNVKIKIKQTNLKKYGVDNPSKNEDIKDKKRKSYLKKYGVDHPLKDKKIKDKIKQTNLKKYGVNCTLNSKDSIEKKKNTWIKNYRVDSPLKNKEILSKIKQTRLNKRLPMLTSYLKNLNLKIINSSVYKKNKTILNFKCLLCNTIFESCYFNVQQGYGRCINCYPKYKSNAETDVLSFIKSLGFETINNSRTVISPYELDIYILDKKVAIEYNGLYYHTEIAGKDSNYHLSKTEKCLNKGIQLIQIFEDEWLFKQDIVKARLQQILNVSTSKKIYARQCKIIEVLPKVKNEFLNTYHIQGKDNSSIKLGAYYNEELVAIMTFAKGNIAKGSKAKEGIWELNRYCSNSNYRVVGIAGKLLKYFQRNYEWKNIYSYADRRWSNGNLYKVLGFKLDSITKPNYWYTKGNLGRIHRFSLRKRPEEPKNIPEWALRIKEGYNRIWDCGHLKFVLKNKER